MTSRTIFAGHGGQGVMLMGYVLSYGAMAKGLNVTYIPSYGPEMRGGTANCTITVSDKKIDSPVTSTPDIVVAMNPPSLEKFGPTIRPGGLAVLNATLIKDGYNRPEIDVLAVPILELARETGSERAANMVMVGALAARTEILNAQEVIIGMQSALKGREKFFDLNEKGIRKGFEFVEKEKKTFGKVVLAGDADQFKEGIA